MQEPGDAVRGDAELQPLVVQRSTRRRRRQLSTFINGCGEVRFTQWVKLVG